jgi:CheY-like chemotaxis protein
MLKAVIFTRNPLPQNPYRIIENQDGDFLLPTPDSAFPRTEKKVYDLVLMDVQMPVMDGLEASRIIRKEQFQIPIIALTATATAENRSECLDAGMNDYISKPVDLEKLKQIISKQFAV